MKFGFDLDGGWFAPSTHITSARTAERLGYESVTIGDHFMPWFDNGAQAPAVWPWLGAALAQTKLIKVGVTVTSPIGARYHPLIVGQAAATLDNMFPGRFLLGVGTGHAMSEQRFLGGWPEWRERADRLREGVALMRRLWTENSYFDWDGRYFKANKIHLYTRPAGEIEVYVSATGKHSARLAGAIGDHLITPVSDPVKVKNEIVPEFKATMKASGRDPSRANMVGYLAFGIGDVQELVRLQRSSSGAEGLVAAARDEMDPRKIQELASQAPVDLLIKHHHIVSKAEELIPFVSELVDAGCNYIMFADQSRRPDENMKKIAEDVIPQLKKS